MPPFRLRDAREDLVDDVTQIDVVAGDDVRRFVAQHGGSLHAWVSQHGWGRYGVALTEAETRPPSTSGMFFRRRRERGFDLQLEASRRLCPRKLVLELRRHGSKVRAYWNGLAWGRLSATQGSPA